MSNCSNPDYVTSAEVNAIKATLADPLSLDAFWLVVNAEIVFLMQLGFMLLEVGSVRAQHAKAICVKNVVDFLIVTITWLTFGYGLAFGERGALGDFAGTSYFFTDGVDEKTTQWANWFFQWAFASATCTIVSGAGAERCSFAGYLLSTMMLSTLVYPVVVHWVWSSDAWLANGSQSDIAFFDFAGSGVVHMVGGSVALMLITTIGAREGRFNAKGEVQCLTPHNLVLAAMGTLLLVMGWFGFNGGSVLAASGGSAALAGRVCAITSIGAASGALTAFFIHYFWGGFIKLEILINGMLAGCVSVTAGANVLTPWNSVIVGIIGGVVYVACCESLLYLQIDDPLEAVPIHGACGIWGVLAVGLFASEEGITGLFYGNGEQFGYQLVGTIVILIWCMGTTGIVFNLIHWYKPTILRVPLDIELTGDLIMYDGSAYPQFETEGEAKIPESGDISVVMSYVQSSEVLRQWDAEIMKLAMKQHDLIIRDNTKLVDGYEIIEDRDGFTAVFNNIYDAIKFATQVQLDMMNAEWPPELFAHEAANMEGLYRGLRVSMCCLNGQAEKLLNRQVSRLKYEGVVMEEAKAVMSSISDGGVVVVSQEAFQALQNDFSHKIPELGSCSLQDVGKYQLPGMAAPIGLIQLMPTALAGRPATEISGGTMLLKSYSLAPGVKIPGTAMAFIFCSLKDEEKDDGNELLTRLLTENEGYLAKTSNGVSLITFESADNGFNFALAIDAAVEANPNIKFSGALHMGTPVSVVPSKIDGRAEYKGPVVKATARIMALAAESDKFKKGKFAFAMSNAAHANLGAEQRSKGHLTGKYNLKGISDGMEIYSIVPQ